MGDNESNSLSPRAPGGRSSTSAASDTAAVLRKVLEDMGVATKQDLEPLGGRLDRIEKAVEENGRRVDEVEQKYVGMQEALVSVKQELEQLRFWLKPLSAQSHSAGTMSYNMSARGLEVERARLENSSSSSGGTSREQLVEQWRHLTIQSSAGTLQPLPGFFVVGTAPISSEPALVDDTPCHIIFSSSSSSTQPSLSQESSGCPPMPMPTGPEVADGLAAERGLNGINSGMPDDCDVGREGTGPGRPVRDDLDDHSEDQGGGGGDIYSSRRPCKSKRITYHNVCELWETKIHEDPYSFDLATLVLPRALGANTTLKEKFLKRMRDVQDEVLRTQALAKGQGGKGQGAARR